MMGFVGQAQLFIMLALGIGGFILELWALLHCVRMNSRSFPAADKRTKNFWLLVTAIAAMVGFIAIPFRGGNLLLMIIAIVPAGIYLTDVRPAVERYGGKQR